MPRSPTSRCAARPCCPPAPARPCASRCSAPAGAKADEALAAGAEAVGMDDLAEKMLAGDLNYDVVIATPDAMRVVGKLGQVLGPRGLMPNPKVGTVSPDAGWRRARTPRLARCVTAPTRPASSTARSARRRFEAAALKPEPARAAGRPDQGQAVDRQGPVPAEDLAQLDHGRRRDRRPELRCRSPSNSFQHGRACRPAGKILKAPASSTRSGSHQRPQVRSARDDVGHGCTIWQGIAVATSGIA